MSRAVGRGDRYLDLRTVVGDLVGDEGQVDATPTALRSFARHEPNPTGMTDVACGAAAPASPGPAAGGRLGRAPAPPAKSAEDGDIDRVLRVMPTFVFLVALYVADQDRALELSARTAELVAES
jgi:hypothetical protein